MSKNTIKRHFADNCVLDEAFKFSGLYTDLCGMSMEDYIKAGTCHCGGGDNDNPGGEVEPIKKSNLLTFTTNSNGFLTAYLNYAPSTTITVNCTCEGTDVVFVLSDGGMEVSDMTPTGEKLSISNVTFNPVEDEKYKYGDYTIMNKTNTGEKIVYTTINIPNFNDLDSLKSLSLDTLSETVVDEDGTIVSFYRPADTEFSIDLNTCTNEEFEAWRKENSYVTALIVNKDDFDNGKVKIFIENDDRTEFFTEINTITINGDTYSILVKLVIDGNGSEWYLDYKGMKVSTWNADTDINAKYIIK